LLLGLLFFGGAMLSLGFLLAVWLIFGPWWLGGVEG
jgi:hypothetical protein